MWCTLHAALDTSGEAKVGDFSYSFFEEYVGRFDVSVHDFECLESLKPFGYLFEEAHGIDLTESFVRSIFHEGCKVAVIAKFQEYVDVIVSARDVVEFDDVGVLHTLQYFYFPGETLHKAFVFFETLASQ